MMVRPPSRAYQIGAFALLIYLPHSCQLYNLLIAGPQEDSGTLKEEGS